MAWWIPEILRVAVLLAGALLVQQLIRRHGVAFAEEVFRATPRAGRGLPRPRRYRLLPDRGRLHALRRSAARPIGPRDAEPAAEHRGERGRPGADHRRLA